MRRRERYVRRRLFARSQQRRPARRLVCARPRANGVPSRIRCARGLHTARRSRRAGMVGRHRAARRGRREAGGCDRSAVTCNAALGRHLWCQTGTRGNTRYRGGFTIADAPEPWGPWTAIPCRRSQPARTSSHGSPTPTAKPSDKPVESSPSDTGKRAAHTGAEASFVLETGACDSALGSSGRNKTTIASDQPQVNGMSVHQPELPDADAL